MSRKILVVCEGNSQRSQALSHYIQEYARINGLDLQVKSAGLNIEFINRIIAKGKNRTWLTDRMIREQDKLLWGESKRENGFRTPISRELVDAADVIIAVDPVIKEGIITLFPNVANKVKVAKEFAVNKPVHNKSIAIEDAYSDKPNQRYRRRSIKDSKETPSPKAVYTMTNETNRLAKRIIHRI